MPTLELTIGNPAHGGHLVSRHEGRVVFVRHALPGERVLAEVTEQRSKLWRAEAVQVLDPSPERVEHVWPDAGPGGVGGGELGHVALPAQRRWKAHVLADTLRRIGDEELVEQVRTAAGGAAALQEISALPGDGPKEDRQGVGTRSRVTLTIDDDRRPAMHEFRSHDLRALRTMPLAHEAILDLNLLGDPRWRRRWRPGDRVEVVAPSVGDPLVLVEGQGISLSGPKERKAVRERVEVAPDSALLPGRELTYRVAAQGFWQIHREAPAALVTLVLSMVAAAGLGTRPGLRALDLYSGAGLFTLPLALAAGEAGAVVSIEGDPRAVADARRNLHETPWATLLQGRVDHASIAAAVDELPEHTPDVVVLDPPRSGAGSEVMSAVARSGAAQIIMVSCDPAAFARDVGTARDLGYRVAQIAALDLFPHTHHFEVVARLARL